MSKKEEIIALYKQNLSIEKIASYTQTSNSYIYKVLSEYRNQYHLSVPSKKQATRRKVLQLLSMGFTVKDVGERMGISVKYINNLKRGY